MQAIKILITDNKFRGGRSYPEPTTTTITSIFSGHEPDGFMLSIAMPVSPPFSGGISFLNLRVFTIYPHPAIPPYFDSDHTFRDSRRRDTTIKTATSRRYLLGRLL